MCAFVCVCVCVCVCVFVICGGIYLVYWVFSFFIRLNSRVVGSTAFPFGFDSARDHLTDVDRFCFFFFVVSFFRNVTGCYLITRPSKFYCDSLDIAQKALNRVLLSGPSDSIYSVNKVTGFAVFNWVLTSLRDATGA